MIRPPPNMAERILECDYILEQNEITIEEVNQIIEVYTQSVEYYESINSDKYIFLGKKLKNVYQNPKVIRVLNSNCGLEAYWYKDKKKE